MNEQEWLASDDVAAVLASLRGEDTLGRTVPFATGHLPPDGRSYVSDRKLQLFVKACRAAGPATDYVSDLSGPGLRVALGYWVSGDGLPLPLARRVAILRELVGNPFRPVTLPKTMRVEVDAWDGGPAGYRMECPWLTPQVLTLAQAAYDERDKPCPYCEDAPQLYDGSSRIRFGKRCACKGTRLVPNDDGTLDPFRLAVLADALEEAGCTDVCCPECESPYPNPPPIPECRCGGTGRLPNPILAHLRSPGPHVRGCHVLDAILGKQ